MFTPGELRLLRSLDTPEKLQDFVDRLRTNFEPHGDTCRSPLIVLRKREAHCIEAALFAAMVLRMHGHRPLIVDLRANKRDFDHVIAVFRRHGAWGAISKSNHYCLGYRDPVYRSIRELVMSYFHEYLNNDGEKTLRSFTPPINLARFDRLGWTTMDRPVWRIPAYADRQLHARIASSAQVRLLRAADSFTKRVNNLQRERP